MTTRTERLRALLEFDNKQAMHMANDFYPGKENHNARYVFIDGAMNQHAKTRAAFEALVSVAESVEIWKKQVDEHGGDYLPGNYKLIASALDRIDKILEGEGT